MKLARCAALLSLAASALALQLPLYADGAAAAAAAAFDAVDSASSGAAGPQRIELPRAQAVSAGAASTEELIARHRAGFTVLTHEEFPEMSVRIKRINAPAAPSGESRREPWVRRPHSVSCHAPQPRARTTAATQTPSVIRA